MEGTWKGLGVAEVLHFQAQAQAQQSADPQAAGLQAVGYQLHRAPTLDVAVPKLHTPETLNVAACDGSHVTG